MPVLGLAVPTVFFVENHSRQQFIVGQHQAYKYTRDQLCKIEVDVEGAVKVLAGSIVGLSTSKNGENKRKQTKTRLNPIGLAIPARQLIRCNGAVFRAHNGNRLFSPLTQLKREFRKCLTLNGKPLCLVDMVCAAPTLLAHKSDDEQLLKDCLSDSYYKRIMTVAEVNRDDAKALFCKYAYGRNRTSTRHGALPFKVTQMMKDRYPKTANYAWNQKSEGPYQNFSHRSQAFEASIFVDGILLELQKQKIPDCIVSQKDNIQDVMGVAEKLFTDRGIRAKFSKEYC